MDAVQSQTQPTNVVTMTADRAESSSLQLSVEAIFYIALVVLTLVLRIADLDLVPMSDVEAIQALPAWHVLNPDAPGTPQPAQSPIVFWLQIISFSLLGATEVAARLPGVIGGVVLSLMPLLFVQRFGRVVIASMSVLLALSPIAIVASRTASPTVWTMVFAVGLLAATWRYWDTRQRTDAWWCAGWSAALLFLSQPGGILLAVVLMTAIGGALWWMILDAPVERETPGDDLWYAARDAVATVPWYSVLGVMALVIVTVGTGFMFYPNGINAVAQTIGGTLRNALQPYQAGAPVAFPLLTLIIYNPLLIVFGAVGAGFALIRRPTFGDRVAMLWVLAAFVALLLYRGGSPAMALWLVIPLVYLTARIVARWLTDTALPPLFYHDMFFDLDEDTVESYWWVKWLVAAGAILLLFMLMLHLGEIGRGLSSLPAQWDFMTLTESPFVQFRYSAIWLLITLMLMIVVYLGASSIFGNDATVQGVGIGVAVFMLLSGVATGWNASVPNATNPAEFWHVTTPTKDVPLLRESLYEVAQRDTRGFPEVPVRVLNDEASGITSDGLIAWLLRDFNQAEFVDTLDIAARDEVVLLPVSQTEPDLGGSYVGQSFALRQTWSPRALRPSDVLAWWIQRRGPQNEFTQDRGVLWLRLDVYNGIPASERP